MKSGRNSFVLTGIPSLFLVFGVLTMAVLALLTLGTSRRDLRESKLSLSATNAYYEACNEASDLVNQLRQILSEDTAADSLPFASASREAAADSPSASAAMEAAADSPSASAALETAADFPSASAATEASSVSLLSFVSWDEADGRCVFEIPFSETQVLHVEMVREILPDQSGYTFSIPVWDTRIIGEWTPDTLQNLYPG